MSWKWKYKRAFDLAIPEECPKDTATVLVTAYRNLRCRNIIEFAEKMGYPKSSIYRFKKAGIKKRKTMEDFKMAANISFILLLLLSSCASRNVLIDPRTCQKIDGDYRELCKEAN